MTLLFIPALLNGDYHAFMVKLAVMLFLFLLVLITNGIDLVTGINASKRTGAKHTTSWGLRRTVSKVLQYFAIFIVMLLLDMGLSVFASYLPIFAIPLMSGLCVIGEIVIEGISIIENTRRGRDPQDDAVDDLQQLAQHAVDAVGRDNLAKYLQELTKYAEERKS